MTVTNTLRLDTFLEEEEDYGLIAIHASSEAYKLAFHLNKCLEIQLVREAVDVDFKHDDNRMAYYQLFKFQNEALSSLYYLFSNKFQVKSKSVATTESLFETTTGSTTNLVPEYKQVDYFLKIEDQGSFTDVDEIAIKINLLKNVIKAYPVDNSTIKSNENLIFS